MRSRRLGFVPLALALRYNIKTRDKSQHLFSKKIRVFFEFLKRRRVFAARCIKCLNFARGFCEKRNICLFCYKKTVGYCFNGARASWRALVKPDNRLTYYNSLSIFLLQLPYLEKSSLKIYEEYILNILALCNILEMGLNNL